MIFINDNLQITWVKLINIYTFQLICNSLFNINNPLSSHPSMSSLWFFQYIFFWNFSNSYIIKFPPFILISIVYKRIVVTWGSIAIMYNKRMKIIRSFLKLRHSISFSYFFIKFFYFVFHFFYLFSQLRTVSFQILNHIMRFFFIIYLFLKRMMINNTSCFFI